MILSYGEILVDMIGCERDGAFAYERHAGGAPFNVACAAKRAGGKAGFVGCVGDDTIGKYVYDFAMRQNLDCLDIAVLPDANTTLAFVELSPDGERSFSFYRKNTADYRLRENAIALVEAADTVHIGSLILGEREGRDFADRAIAAVKKAGKRLSFDVNYREDIFPDPVVAKEIYGKVADAADIVKYAEEELAMFTGKSVSDGIKDIARPGKLVCVTLGGKGCMYALGDRVRTVPSISVTPVDTTGAGDAFFGALLSKLDGRDFNAMTDGELDGCFRFACIAGALATTTRGAIDGLPTEEQIMRYL